MDGEWNLVISCFWKEILMVKLGGCGKKKIEIVFFVCEEMGDYNYIVWCKFGGEKLWLKKYLFCLCWYMVYNEKKK